MKNASELEIPRHLDAALPDAALPDTALPPAGTFHRLIGRVRSGDEEAAGELVRLYEPMIRRAARIRLTDSHLRRLFDSMDIAQSVFASFFVRAALGQFELENADQLLRLLVTMSRKKLIDHVRQQQAARRNYRRATAVGREVIDPRADPGRQAAAQDLLQAIRARLSADERRLAELRAQNLGWDRVAAEVGRSAESVRKQLTRAIARVARELGLDELGHA
jgi:RNA polymerase sigma-70 factor (ECF subfamily)